MNIGEKLGKNSSPVDLKVITVRKAALGLVSSDSVGNFILDWVAAGSWIGK